MSRFMRSLFFLPLALVLCSTAPGDEPGDEPGGKIASKLKRPIALALSDDDKWLFVANHRGSVSIIDMVQQSAVSEIETGGQLNDLALLDERHLLALDETHHQVLVLTGDGAQWSLPSRCDVASYPLRLKVDREARRCFVASLWSRTVTAFDVAHLGQEHSAAPRMLKELRLSFEPREMCLTRDGKRLIVAGAFLNKLAIIDTEDLQLITEKKIRGHNIRGLAISGDEKRLLIAQQELNSIAHSTFDDVHWGSLISNQLVALPLAELCDPQVEVVREAHYLGEPGKAAGDPGPIHIGSNGKMAIVLAGVNEVALTNDDDAYFPNLRRFSVENGPSAVVQTSDGIICVANRFSDSISRIDVRGEAKVTSIALGEKPALTPEERGEMLFFDSRLSHDGWMSCHSCHADGHSNGLLNDNFSDGSFGAPKRVLSLLGVGETSPWAWNGHVQSLEQQVLNSVRGTMQGAAPTEQQIADLTAYLKSLQAPPPLSRTSKEPAPDISRGLELFRTLKCDRCHTAPTYTSAAVYDVGLSDAIGNDHFNPPSLRGVARRHAFFHDGRATTLREVFATHQHQLDRELSIEEIDALVKYLESL